MHAQSLAFLAQCGQPWLPEPCTTAEVRRSIGERLRTGNRCEPGACVVRRGERLQDVLEQY